MTTTQTMLNVSYNNKEYAKQAGARWNPSKKSWYIETHKYVEYTKTYKKLIQENKKQEQEQKQKKGQQTKIYLDDDDIYIREYAEYDEKGYYITFDKLKHIIDSNNRRQYEYYICTICCIHVDKIINLAGVKTYKYKHIESSDKQFNNSMIPGINGKKYYVINNRIKLLFNIITNSCSIETANLGVLFDACLRNYNVITHMTEHKIRYPYVVDNQYDIYIDMQSKYYKIYKNEIMKKLNKYFYKDVSNIINDYLIQYIKVPEITREEYEKL